MNKIEGVMSYHGAKQPFKTLASLVKESQEVWDKKKKRSMLTLSKETRSPNLYVSI